jgi:hypothetical protein
MARRYQFRDRYGRFRRPNLPPYRRGGQILTGRARGVRGVSFEWQPGVHQLGDWISAAVTDEIIQRLVERLKAVAPRSSVSHGAGTPRPWPHMQDSIHGSLEVTGSTVYGENLSGGAVRVEGEVFIGFPVGLIEYGTVKMPAQPFVGPTYDAVDREVPSIVDTAWGAAGR